MKNNIVAKRFIRGYQTIWVNGEFFGHIRKEEYGFWNFYDEHDDFHCCGKNVEDALEEIRKWIDRESSVNENKSDNHNIVIEDQQNHSKVFKDGEQIGIVMQIEQNQWVGSLINEHSHCNTVIATDKELCADKLVEQLYYVNNKGITTSMIIKMRIPSELKIKSYTLANEGVVQ